MRGSQAPEETGEAAEAPSTPAVARTGIRSGRFRRRSIEGLRCGTPRRVARVEGECPCCGYVGWKPGHRRLVALPGR